MSDCSNRCEGCATEHIATENMDFATVLVVMFEKHTFTFDLPPGQNAFCYGCGTECVCFTRCCGNSVCRLCFNHWVEMTPIHRDVVCPMCPVRVEA